MKNISLFALLGLLFATSCQPTQPAAEYAADTPEVRYVGRVERAEGSVSFDWSGTYLEIRFRGEEIVLRLSDTKKNYYNLTLDGQEAGVVATHGCDSLLTLAQGLSNEEHTLRLQKRTEGEQGRTTLHAILLPQGGELLPTEAPTDRHIEFIGDSLTAGYGTEGLSKEDPFLAETENCNWAHSCIIARYFGADYNLLAHSGRGVARNYGDINSTSEITMAEYIERTFDEDPASQWDWAQSPHRPDIVVIHLGTNDFSTQPFPSKEEFTADYRRILNSVRGGYGAEVPILCVAPYVGSPCFDYLKALVAEQPVENLHFAAVHHGYCNDSSELGSSAHPNYEGQRKMAMTLIPYISTLTGWEASHRTIE